MRKVLLFVCVIAAALSMTACLSKPAAEEKPAGRVLTDRSGTEITLPEQMQRVVSLNAATTEMIIGLGLGEMIIGADYYSRQTLAAYGLPVDGVREYDMMNPDAETILSQKPDIVFATEMSLVSDPDVFKMFASVGVTVTIIPGSSSVEAIIEDIIFVADALGDKAKGVELAQEMEREISEIAEIGKTITDKKTVYFEIAESPSLYTFGNGVFLNRFIELIGAVNIFGDNDGWLAVSEETVLVQNPDVILTSINYIEDATGQILRRSGWDVVTAVKNGDVYYIDNDASSRASQNVIKALREMAKAVYPDKY